MEGLTLYKGRVVDNADPTDQFLLSVTSDRSGNSVLKAWPVLHRNSHQRLPPPGASVWLIEDRSGTICWLGEWAPDGVSASAIVEGHVAGSS